ncbi:MAG: hypothetical protein K2X41_12335 [Hyphomicrobium sp.]|nr:hypothetical protein [Hyphomicrobium sp.]
MKFNLSMAAAMILLSSSAVMAAETTAAPAVTKPVATHAASDHAVKKMKTATVRSEKSKKCSADADAKSLHGKERRAFRKTCLKAA